MQVIEENKTPVGISDDLTDTKAILREIIQAWNDSPTKSRYRSLVITHLEIAEGFLLKAQAND
jgi:hypothetical protein